jgi:hypothetical protein
MTSTPPASHTPARRRASAAVLIATAAATAALGFAAVPALASAAPATAVLTGPTVHEQQALNQNIAIATGGGRTTAISSPVLAAHSYLVNLAIGVDNITPGSVVLCGLTTSTTTDVVTGNYGQVENEGSTASSGNCAVTGTVTLNNPSDHILAWASVYTGPGGATIGDTSMNEQPVGTVVITH